MRQWDTKRQFQPDYKHVAKIVFCGLALAISHPDWGYTLRELGEAVGRLARNLGGILLAAALLLLSPIAFPVLCLACKHSARRRRLDYLRRMRAADEDF